ncbi:hypothetical protein D4R78_04020 [bacterium]|nr:MAG: hypothetical protein D4R78_04020 [bacterium]
MPRVKFLQSRQSIFPWKVKEENNIDWPNFARICNVNRRTLLDWRRDKYQMSYASLQSLRNKLKIPVKKI